MPFEVPAAETATPNVPHETTPDAPLESRAKPPQRTSPATVEDLRPRDPAPESKPDEAAGKPGKEKPQEDPATSRRAIRQELKERLKERIRQKQAEIDSLIREKGDVQRALQKIIAELKSIRAELKGGDDP